MPREEKSRVRTLNFSAKKTEAQWAETLHGMAEDFAATWFKWLGWLLALGAIAFIAEKTGSGVIRGIEIISYVVLVFYFNQFFYSFRIEPYESWIAAQTTNLRLFLGVLPAVTLTTIFIIATNRLIYHAVQQVQLAK